MAFLFQISKTIQDYPRLFQDFSKTFPRLFQDFPRLSKMSFDIGFYHGSLKHHLIATKVCVIKDNTPIFQAFLDKVLTFSDQAAKVPQAYLYAATYVALYNKNIFVENYFKRPWYKFGDGPFYFPFNRAFVASFLKSAEIPASTKAAIREECILLKMAELREKEEQLIEAEARKRLALEKIPTLPRKKPSVATTTK
jgi:hypothetical protein